MAIINFNIKNLKPNKVVIKEAVITGIVASLVLFLLNFIGIMFLFQWIPKGFEVFVLVFVAVWLKHLFDVKV